VGRCAGQGRAAARRRLVGQAGWPTERAKRDDGPLRTHPLDLSDHILDTGNISQPCHSGRHRRWVRRLRFERSGNRPRGCGVATEVVGPASASVGLHPWTHGPCRRHSGSAAMQANMSSDNAPTFFPPGTLRVDHEYQGVLTQTVGGVELEHHHAMGETDDHTWTWIPDRKTITAGDLFIWNFPNRGNPQKVQRYPLEWAAALREMTAKDAELFVPAHGLPIRTPERIAKLLNIVATTLETLTHQVIDAMRTPGPSSTTSRRTSCSHRRRSRGAGWGSRGAHGPRRRLSSPGRSSHSVSTDRVCGRGRTRFARGSPCPFRHLRSAAQVGIVADGQGNFTRRQGRVGRCSWRRH